MTEGRLYRSGGAEGAAAEAATPALSKDQRSKLKSTSISQSVVEEPVAVEAVAVETVRPEFAAAPISVAAIDVDESVPEDVAPPSRGSVTLNAKQVWLLICGVTFLIGLIDGFFHRGGSEASALTAITGIALVLSTIVAALLVRPGDRWYPVIVPPIAFLIATLTAGQFGLSSTGSLLIREGLMVFTTLGRNAVWIFIAVIAAAVIGLVKSRVTK